MLEREKTKRTTLTSPVSTGAMLPDLTSKDGTPCDFKLGIENISAALPPSKISYVTQIIDFPDMRLSSFKKLKTNHQTFYLLAFGIFLKLFSGQIQFPISGIFPSTKKNNSSTALSTFLFDIDFRTHHTHSALEKIKEALTHQHPCSEKTDYPFSISSTVEKKIKPYKLGLWINQINQVCLHFQKSYFKPQTIQTCVEYYKKIVFNLIEHHNKLFSKIQWIPEKDLKKLFGDFSHPNYELSNFQDQLVYDAFVKSAQAYPNQMAITSEQQQITYAELNAEINAIAAHLLKKSIRPGDRVAVLLDRTPQLFSVLFALFKIGAIYVPLNPKLPNERLSHIIQDCQAQCLITQHHSLDYQHLPIQNIWLLPKRWQDIPCISPEKWLGETPLVSLQDPAYILYTSGTTGTPKGVVIHHGNLSHLVNWYHHGLCVNPNDRASQFASQGFDTSLCESLPFLTRGASVHIVEDHIKLSPNDFFDWLKKNEISICDLPTAYAQTLFGLKWPTLPKLRLVKIGGESLNQYPSQSFTFDIWNTYGPTETTIEATYVKLYSANTIYKNKSATPPIGKPIPNTQVYIVNEELQLLPVGVVGELLIGGKGLSSGYWNLPKKTAERFIINPFSKQKGKLYRTGDLVRFKPDGQLDFIGRKDHQVKIRGYRIELSDISITTSQFSDVGEVVIVPKDNRNGEKTLVAYVVPNLNQQRFPYQERCLITIKNKTMLEGITDNLSKHGLGLCGVLSTLNIGESVQVQFKLPGVHHSSQITADVVWQRDDRCGLRFHENNNQLEFVSKSVDYLIASQNTKELFLNAAAKRNLKIALKKKLPDYMIPSQIVMLSHFPLNFNGKIDIKALPEPDFYSSQTTKNALPPQTATEKKLCALACRILKLDSIGIDDHFFELGGTSITAAEWLVNIYEQFGITIPSKLLIDFPFISVLANYIDKKGKVELTHEQTERHILKDAELDESIVPGNSSIHNLEPEHILLTGASGFLGVFLLHSLLTKTKAKIYCIVRRGEFQTAAKRLSTVINQFKLNDLISLNDRRIAIIPGDLSLAHFGLSEEHYQMLQKKIDSIIHCGAQVNTMASYSALRESNVTGTKYILQLATECKNKPIHYISTLSAAYMKNKKEELSEIFPDLHFQQLTGGYAISKWVSERLISQAQNRGLPCAIYRLGYIGGHSKQGISNLNDALLMMIKGCILMGCAPNWKEVIDILPVDFVADSIVQIALEPKREESVFHINHPVGIVWTDLMTWLNQYGYSIKLLPMKQWQSKLKDLNPNHPLFPLIPSLLNLSEMGSPKVSLTHTKKIFKKMNIKFPKLGDAELKNYLQFLHQTGFLEAPRKKLKK